jgi:predicted RNA binding protein YcfA (HicA-like mRNA interferase family)
MLTSNKDLKLLLKNAEARGWVFSKGVRHIKGKHPSGKTTTISVSPSDNRALKNIERDLRIGDGK